MNSPARNQDFTAFAEVYNNTEAFPNLTDVALELGRKRTISDKHSPEIVDGVYVAGCMNLRHGYNKGPSGWAVAHVVQYAMASARSSPCRRANGALDRQ